MAGDLVRVATILERIMIMTIKNVKCYGCGADIEIDFNYEPEFCCSGRDCLCRGEITNPLFCDDCWRKIEEYERQYKNFLETKTLKRRGMRKDNEKKKECFGRN